MEAKDFVVGQLQSSFFTPEVLFNKNKILEFFLKEYSSALDGETMSVPLPPDTPADVVSIILTSKDGKYRIEIAESRVNIYINRIEEKDISFKSFNDFVLDVCSKYKALTNARIGRLALVSTKHFLTETPGLLLSRHFCQERFYTKPFNRPDNFELHAHKTYKCKNFDVNSWVRCKTGRYKEKYRIILVIQDINTLAEQQDRTFELEECISFLDVFQKEQTEILKMYFPNE